LKKSQCGENSTMEFKTTLERSLDTGICTFNLTNPPLFL
jgi:hypothetical protein